MAADWGRLCRAKDFEVDESYIEVKCSGERRQRVAVEDQGDAYMISAFVVRQAVAASHPDFPIQAWLRNRALMLVGFRIDRQNRLVGEAWIPKAGLVAEEFQLYVRMLATECDRFEYALTGKDVE